MSSPIEKTHIEFRCDQRDETPEAQEFASELRRFEEQLLRTLEPDTVDDGRIHAGESLLAEAFEKHPEQTSLWARKVVEGTVAWPERAATLRLLARLTPMDAAWRAQIVSSGCVRATLSFEMPQSKPRRAGPTMKSFAPLRTHSDPVPWLNEYASQVIKTLRPR